MNLLQDHFEVNIVDCPAKYLVGLKIRTTIPRSSIDCPSLWENFKSRLGELSGASRKKSYSFFKTADQHITVDYWVAVEMSRSHEIPQGMQCIELPAGKFAKCIVPNSASLLQAQNYIFSNWSQTQKEYAVDVNAPCFELYPPQWQPNEAFDLCISLVPGNSKV